MQVALNQNAEPTFDIEEFKALRQEILQNVAASYRLEIYAVSGAAAIYAWLATRSTFAPAIWYLPVLLSFLGSLRAKRIGYQMLVAGDYLRVLEKRLRPAQLTDLNHEVLDVHGWEGYVHHPIIWNKFRDLASLYFWILFILSTILLPYLLLPSRRFLFTSLAIFGVLLPYILWLSRPIFNKGARKTSRTAG